MQGPRIAIIGAGLGGIPAGIMLQRAGYDVRLYEQAAQIARIGAGINLGPNVMKVMRHLGLADTMYEIGLVPRQNSTGGKTRLGRITKAGNREIRRLLVLGATSMLGHAEGWHSALGGWLRNILQRRPARLATVALANTGFPSRSRDGVPQMARIAWAVMTRNEVYRPRGGVAAKA